MSNWISIYERLPEDKQFVLVTVDAGVETDAGISTCEWVCIADYQENDEPFPYFGIHGYGDPKFRTEVLAWMPLPEPYKGEDE